MEVIALVYLLLGGITVFAMLVVLFVIAGKDIFYAFYRKMVPRGCDIFVLKYNRQIDHYYRIPKKEGYFKIKGATYVLNPSKVLSLSDDERVLVQGSLNKRIKYIDEFEKIKNVDGADEMKAQLNGEIANLEGRINMLKEKLKEKNKTYYYRRRPTILYIENDPVPKDMFEFYTEFDSTMIDNIIARSMTKDPKAVADLEKYLKLFKLALIIIGGAVVLTLLVVFKIQTGLTQIADSLGITLQM